VYGKMEFASFILPTFMRKLAFSLMGWFDVPNSFRSTCCLVVSQGCCVNAPMIAVADYTKGSEGFTYNYYVMLSFYM
jgi:hypothetical protein